MTSLAEIVELVIGVDTHVDTHTAAAVDAATGAVRAQLTVPATPAGYADLVEFADQASGLRAWAIEGTGSHGAGLTRHLSTRNELVVEIDRPHRPARRYGAKSDDLDAVRAAREALTRTTLATPRSDADRYALSVRLAVRHSAIQARTVAGQQLFALLIAAPQLLRDRLAGQPIPAIAAAAARLRIHPSWDTATRHTAAVLRDLAHRYSSVNTEVKAHDKAILDLVRSWRPDLLDQCGIGPIVAATILCAWSHPGRIGSEAAFAMLAGVAPIPASSGKVTHHRLNRYGDRRLNQALHTIVLCRQRTDPQTRDYTARRTTEGKSTRSIRRCLKRYVARDLYRLLEHPPTPLDKT